jgi:hypothetical protein
MRIVLLCAAVGLASCARAPAAPDPLVVRERICGEERQTSRWHNCNARFIAERPEMLGLAATDLLSSYHRAAANALLAMEERRMSQAEGRDVIERLTDTMQRDLPAAKARDSAARSPRAAVCFPLSGGGQYCPRG